MDIAISFHSLQNHTDLECHTFQNRQGKVATGGSQACAVEAAGGLGVVIGAAIAVEEGIEHHRTATLTGSIGFRGNGIVVAAGEHHVTQPAQRGSSRADDTFGDPGTLSCIGRPGNGHFAFGLSFRPELFNGTGSAQRDGHNAITQANTQSSTLLILGANSYHAVFTQTQLCCHFRQHTACGFTAPHKRRQLFQRQIVLRQNFFTPALVLDVIHHSTGSHGMVGHTVAGKLGQQKVHGHQELPCLVINFGLFLPQPQQMEEGIAGMDPLAGVGKSSAGTPLLFQAVSLFLAPHIQPGHCWIQRC